MKPGRASLWTLAVTAFLTPLVVGAICSGFLTLAFNREALACTPQSPLTDGMLAAVFIAPPAFPWGLWRRSRVP